MNELLATCPCCNKFIAFCTCVELFENADQVVTYQNGTPQTAPQPQTLTVDLISFCLEIQYRSLCGVARVCRREGREDWVEICFLDCVPLIDLDDSELVYWLSNGKEKNREDFERHDFAIAVDSMPMLWELFGNLESAPKK
jgi:hypothetical protein